MFVDDYGVSNSIRCNSYLMHGGVIRCNLDQRMDRSRS